MRRLILAFLIVIVSVATADAQTALTEEQRIADLNQLAGFYAKNYAPYEWKRDVIGFDLLRLNQWFQEIHKTNDLDYQETLISYVASLNDAHCFISFPASFAASLPLGVDIYDGKVLIDRINRTALPIAQFPFVIGDELISIDGSPVQDVIASFRKYEIAANQRSTDRFAASLITSRSQQIFPHLSDLGDTATLVIRSGTTGAQNAYVIPWVKTGIPITSQGPVPSPGRQPFREAEQVPGTASGPGSGAGAGAPPSFFHIANVATIDDTLPSYMTSIAPLLNASVPPDRYAVLNFGGKFPIYAPPPGFVQRLGASSADFFLTGTFVSNGLRIGLIRIPSMAPPSAALALQQLDKEMAFFNANTDGLIVDVMRNPGGSISFLESLAQRFIPTPFQTLGFEIRATETWLNQAANSVTAARLSNAPPEIIQNLQNRFDEILRAYNEERGRSAPVSLNSTGSLLLAPSPGAYNKPLLVLVDELSASAADMFPAILQDNHRGPIFGMRTMGAGGSVVGYNATAYTESFFTITVSLANRGHLIQTTDFPPAPYIENIGVRPDIVQDYMTRTNLLTGGSAFVQAFTAAIVNLVQSSQH